MGFVFSLCRINCCLNICHTKFMTVFPAPVAGETDGTLEERLTRLEERVAYLEEAITVG